MHILKTTAIILIFATIPLQYAICENPSERELEEVKGLKQMSNELYHKGKPDEAIPYAEKILAIHEEKLGKESLEVATSLDDLAILYRETGRLVEAESLHQKALKIREKKVERDHPSIAQSYYHLASLYRVTGKYKEAEKQYRKALEIREKVLPKDHPKIAQSLSGLAFVCTPLGRYSEAESFYKRALEIREKTLEKDHLDTAHTLSSLGFLYSQTGQYAEGEVLLKRALKIREKALGMEHLDTVQTLQSLGSIYWRTGRYAEAESIYKRALEIRQKILKRDHPSIASNLNLLGWVYYKTRRYDKAASFMKKAIEMQEKTSVDENPQLAHMLNDLAELYRTTGRYKEAEPLYDRCLKIRRKLLGKDHPFFAQTLNNLALLYVSTQRQREAEILLKQALEIREKTLGKDHPDTAKSLFNLALRYAVAGGHRESHQLFKKGIAIIDKAKENAFLVLSEKQKLSYMEENKNVMNMFMTHTALFLSMNDQATIDTFNIWIKWKGAVLEAQGRYMDALMHSDNPDIQRKFVELTELRRDMARLQLSKPEAMDIEDYVKRLEELEKRKESLEAELSRLSKDFALDRVAGEADIKRIGNILPHDSVYLDFAMIQTHRFRGKGSGPLRYLAFILLPGKEATVKLIEIEKKNNIDPHIEAYLKEMEKVKQTQELPNINVLRREARILYELVMKPIEPYLRGKKQLFISPDGMLNLIPFEVLISSEGISMLEEYLIHYVATGRDIVRFSDTTVARGDALIMADPDYEMGLRERDKVAGEMKVAKAIRGDVSRDAGGLNFSRLPETREEADNIEKILMKYLNQAARNYQDKNALEEILFSMESPKLLHLATHGYFLKDEEAKEILGGGLEDQDTERVMGQGFENPMLRSGIVLAGANASLREGRDDGVVSAEKILGLKLKGTEMVVLSACETGVGDVRSGEGVFGLKRAFILSGAKTVVMSLWSVPSKETTELMTRFYTLMSEGKTKAEALRQSKTEMMMKKKNPFYWGAFIMVGKPE